MSNSSEVNLSKSLNLDLEPRQIIEIINRTAQLTDQRTAMNGCGGFPLPDKWDTISLKIKRFIKGFWN